MRLSLLVGHDDADCAHAATTWQRWSNNCFLLTGKRPAMLDLAADYDELIGAKGRNMLRKAHANADFLHFHYNQQLDGMHAVNVSMPVRAGRPMSESYLARPMPQSAGSHCGRHKTHYIGAFLDDGVLGAYAFLSICGELAVVNRFIGKPEAMRLGAMNGLIYEMVRVARFWDCRLLNYLTMESSTSGLTSFKKHVGFRATDVEFAL